MIGLASWLGTLWGRVVIGGALIAALALWRASDVRTQREIGAAKVADVARKAGAEANEKNRKVRAAARQPGAFERLLKRSCRDC